MGAILSETELIWMNRDKTSTIFQWNLIVDVWETLNH